MTGTPPNISDNPQDSGEGPSPTQVEKDAQAAARQTELTATPLGYADHRLYSMPLYNQPSWVIDAVFASEYLEQDAQYTQSQVQGAIDQMMAVPDNQFPTEETP
jgi:hypothetical protein